MGKDKKKDDRRSSSSSDNSAATWAAVSASSLASVSLASTPATLPTTSTVPAAVA